MGRPEPGLPLSPFLRDLPPYVFADLDVRRRELEARGLRVIDLGMGDPQEPTPAFVREALAGGVTERAPYPRAVGRADLRRAAAEWMSRRFGVRVDPEWEVLPVNGTKELIFSLPLAVVDREERPLVLVPEPAYPIYAAGARAAGAEVLFLPLAPEHGWLPDLDAVSDAEWRHASLLWINTPHNPTGAVAPPSFLSDAAERCRRHGVLLASDEAYSEIYAGEPPATALAAGSENVLVLHSLSKRSGMAGYRSGFLAGDARLVEALKRFRPLTGCATPEFVQAAACAAWSDDTHVAGIRERFRERRAVLGAGLRRLGWDVPESPGVFFLWVPVPGGGASAAFAARCLEHGVVVLPGAALGPSGEGYVRLSLTAEVSALEEVLVRLARVPV